MFACSDGRLVHVQRRAGAILAHDGDAVHAVTALVKGTRLVESCRRLFLHQNFTESPLLFLRRASSCSRQRQGMGCLPFVREICCKKATRQHLAKSRQRLSGRSARIHTPYSVSPQSHGFCFRRPARYGELYLVSLSAPHFIDAFASPELLICRTSRVRKPPCFGMPRLTALKQQKTWFGVYYVQFTQ